MKWLITILLVLNLWLGVYGFGLTFTTLNIHRDLTAQELRAIRSDLEAVTDLLFSLDATFSDDYKERILSRINKRRITNSNETDD